MTETQMAVLAKMAELGEDEGLEAAQAAGLTFELTWQEFEAVVVAHRKAHPLPLSNPWVHCGIVGVDGQPKS